MVPSRSFEQKHQFSVQTSFVLMFSGCTVKVSVPIIVESILVRCHHIPLQLRMLLIELLYLGDVNTCQLWSVLMD